MNDPVAPSRGESRPRGDGIDPTRPACSTWRCSRS